MFTMRPKKPSACGRFTITSETFRQTSTVASSAPSLCAIPKPPGPTTRSRYSCTRFRAPRKVRRFRVTTLGNGGVYSHTFATAANVPYHCKIHGTSMAGNVVVDPAAPAGNRSVAIGDNFFNPVTVTVRPGNTVTWTNNGNFDHIVFAPGGGVPSFCLNGRTYVGNTPTIEVAPGDRLRWYLANLDLSSVWHNFHPHSARWQLPTAPGGMGDVHPLSPAQTFVIDTEAPPALRLPCESGTIAVRPAGIGLPPSHQR